MYHKPVLINEVIAYLKPQPHGVYIDATFGGGGHTRAILQAESTCRVIALDWDKKAIDLNGPALKEEFGDRLTLVWGNFANLKQLMKKYDIEQVSGILADFGTSQFQIKERAGFSFAADTPLDMRMSPGHQKITAAEIINKASEEDLIYIFREYGEEKAARMFARAIVAARKEKRFYTTGDLVGLITNLMPGRPRGIHPATRVFQALRIAVNQELANIESFLKQSVELLAPKGRLVCISFHSLEDRIVKQFIKDQKAVLKNLTPKIITATPAELAINSSSRSAKLRAAEKLSAK